MLDTQTKYFDYVDDATVRNVLYSSLVLLVLYYVASLRVKPLSGFEVIGVEKGDWTFLSAQRRFSNQTQKVLQEGIRRCKGGIFQIIGHAGPALVVGHKYLEDIRNNPHMDLSEISTTDFFTKYAAFSPMKAGQDSDIILKVVNKKLTQALALITEPVNEENTIAMKQLFPEAKEWTPTPFVQNAMLLTSQVSSRIFLGTPICRDPEWVKIGRDFTMDLMFAAFSMKIMPSIIRPFMYYILPPVWKLKNTVKKATKIIQPEVIRRRKARAEALASGEKIPKHLDSIDWLDEIAYPEFDFVGGQLVLTFVAVHTTSNTLVNILYDLIEHPELLVELREEMIQALKEDGGFLKTTLFKMKLLDSFMKESQRLNVLSTIIMQRKAHEEVTFSDGTVIPKGSRLMVSSAHHYDPELYPDPTTFDGKRFLNLRNQPGNANKFQFVTTSADHIAFGHGQHACPGRFFASNEIKVMLCHMLLKYEWKFKDGVRPKNLYLERSERILDDKAEILYKSRTPEIDLANIKVA